MKIPHVLIRWTSRAQLPVTIEVRELSNGYLIGSTYFATESKLVEELTKYVKDPHSYHEPPQYTEA